jgi:hypothetical protein
VRPPLFFTLHAIEFVIITVDPFNLLQIHMSTTPCVEEHLGSDHHRIVQSVVRGS